MNYWCATRKSWTRIPYWLPLVCWGWLLVSAAPVSAQTVINLGKPTPDAQNTIVAPIHTQLIALPPSAATCTAPVIPITGNGQYAVSFTASPDHAVLGQGGVPTVDHYEARLPAVTTSQPCATLQVVAVGPGGEGGTPLTSPFALKVASPAPPAGLALLKR